MRVDIHQHLWSEPLLRALALRDQPPRLACNRGGEVLHCDGEQPYLIDPAAQQPELRAAQLAAEGIDLALVAISSPVGIEALPREQALELIEAHLLGVESLGPRFGAWGALALDGPSASDVDALVRRGCVGVSLPAGALCTLAWLERSGPLLERAEALEVPVFVHPGPAPGRPQVQPPLSEPLWWRALTGYVAQLQAAWLAFATRGRREHPRLRVVFAALAGLAPLQLERLATRGGPPVELDDPLTFYETSSYGPEAVEAMARVLDERRLLYGSDRPVLQPLAGERDPELQANAATLLASAAAVRAA